VQTFKQTNRRMQLCRQQPKDIDIVFALDPTPILTVSMYVSSKGLSTPKIQPLIYCDLQQAVAEQPLRVPFTALCNFLNTVGLLDIQRYHLQQW
jgi:hypothetical protein